MDFTKQCRRFINFERINHEHFKRKLMHISALTCLRTGPKPALDVDPADVAEPPLRFVIADNREQSLTIMESDSSSSASCSIVKQADQLGFTTYSMCSVYTTGGSGGGGKGKKGGAAKAQNFIYVSDFANNCVRKFDENLHEVKKLTTTKKRPFNGPCGIAYNEQHQRIYVVDQRNWRVIIFSSATDELIGEHGLFETDLNNATKYAKPSHVDLSARTTVESHVEQIREEEALNFWPFGLSTRGERVFVTDWNRSTLYIYKNGVLERKVSGAECGFTRPRDTVLDSNGNVLVTDLDQHGFFFLDNLGNFLFETPLPTLKNTEGEKKLATQHHKDEEKGVFGASLANDKLVFATNSSVYVCNLVY